MEVVRREADSFIDRIFFLQHARPKLAEKMTRISDSAIIFSSWLLIVASFRWVCVCACVIHRRSSSRLHMVVDTNQSISQSINQPIANPPH